MTAIPATAYRLKGFELLEQPPDNAKIAVLIVADAGQYSCKDLFRT
jgi:hypothetical protein